MKDGDLSRFLSFVLRHDPDSIGLALDGGGWAEVAALIERSAAAGRAFDRGALLRVVAADSKRRFTLSNDGDRIRAAQGHSVSVDLGLAPSTPPAILYHGTATRFLDAIMAQGLRPGSRQSVHLSATVGTATAVGRRHGTPVVLRVDAAGLAGAGQVFWRAENGVWLTGPVAPGFLRLLTEVGSGAAAPEADDLDGAASESGVEKR